MGAEIDKTGDIQAVDGITVREATRAELREDDAFSGAISAIGENIDSLSDEQKKDIIGELVKFPLFGGAPDLQLPDGEEDEVQKRVELLEDENRKLKEELEESKAKNKKFEDLYKKEKFEAYVKSVDLVLSYVDCVKTRDAIHTMLDAVSNLKDIV
jgi:hypothetical protein